MPLRLCGKTLLIKPSPRFSMSFFLLFSKSRSIKQKSERTKSSVTSCRSGVGVRCPGETLKEARRVEEWVVETM